jgi:LEA14-like dessication related protein
MLWLLLAMVLVLALAAAGAVLTYRSAPPVVKLVGLRPQSLSTTTQQLQAKLRIENPAPLPLPVRALTYRVWLDTHEIASGEATFARWIPARAETFVEVSVSADARRLARALPALAMKRQPWPYRLAGTLTPAARLALGYDHHGEIDARGILKLAASLR